MNMSESEPIAYITEPENFCGVTLKKLEEEFDVRIGNPMECLSKSDVKVIWVRLANYWDMDRLNLFPNLEYIVTATTGLNHIDVDYCTVKNIEIISLQGEARFLNSITSTAELIFSHILTLSRKTVYAHKSVVEDCLWDRNSYLGSQLSGKKLGILGMGRIGKILCDYARAFRMEVVYYDKKVNMQHDHAKAVSLDELFRNADFLSICANFTKDNSEFVNEDLLSQLKPTSYLINCARGELLDEGALLRLLEADAIAGAAIDVLADENRVELYAHPLRMYAERNENLIITPHIGGACIDAMQATEKFIMCKLLKVIRERD
jgi:D-3-phosphoglycerate dehydrogenase / 2-oxoglutarate reductase